ncbi:phage tail protein [Pseudomonas carnis]|nr:phage tail protein [Pseudomonas fluorescens]
MDSPPPTVEQLASIERAWRDTQLLDTDGIINRHRDEVEGGGETTLTMEQYRSLQVYRQGLRNWPEAPIFPDSTGRPVAPTWLVEQLSE